MPAEIVDGEDVRVGESGHRLRLTLEAREGVAILGQPGGKHLYRDVPLELVVSCR
jgi:hypothetical protein